MACAWFASGALCACSVDFANSTEPAPNHQACPRCACLPGATCRVAPALQPSEDDLAALATARGVMDLVQRAPTPLPGPPSPSDALRLAQEVGPLLPELMPGMARTGQMFATALVQRVSVRVAADLQPGAAGAAGPGSTDGEA